MCTMPERPRTIILALYIEPKWLQGVPARLGRERRAGLLRASRRARFRRASASLRDASGGRHDGASRCGCATHEQTAVGSDDRGDRAFHALAQLSDLDPRHERDALRLAHPPRRWRRCARSDVSATMSISLAKGAGLSRAQFFRLFESSLGVPPKVYLNVVRMERAVDAVMHEDDAARRDQRRGLVFRSRRISRASSAIMPASARANSATSRGLRADRCAALRCTLSK